MRTSLTNIKAIEDYIMGRIAPEETLLFEANLLLNKDLANDTQDQQKTYALIRRYGRQQIKDEIVAVQKILVNQPEHRGFMRRIVNLFKKY